MKRIRKILCAVISIVLGTALSTLGFIYLATPYLLTYRQAPFEGHQTQRGQYSKELLEFQLRVLRQRGNLPRSDLHFDPPTEPTPLLQITSDDIDE